MSHHVDSLINKSASVIRSTSVITEGSNCVMHGVKFKAIHDTYLMSVFLH